MDFNVTGLEVYRINLSGPGRGPSESFCEIGNEHLFP